ncbi:MAG: hypothetical protein E7139_08020 [Rikenellaceae bacterium]|nr:hypothetical protein [Rikenellaceae bacterium]
MKRMINLLRVVAVAAVALTSCQNNFEEVTNEVVKGNVVVNFVAQSTRTSVDTTGDAPIFSWSENETFAVLEQTDALAEATNVTYENVDGKASIKAELAANPGKDAYQYVVVYPETGYVSAESLDKATLALPAEQTMAEESYDPTADLMVSMPVQTTAQPTEAQYVRFARLAAVAKMTVNNLNLGADEQIERVEFTAAGKALAGTINVDLTNPEEFTAGSTLSTVSVATTSADKVYFTLLPTTLEAGDVYSVAVVTNKKVYIKQGTIPEGKSLVFEAGKVTRIGVNMTDVEGIDKWSLVRDASTLKEGDVVAIVAKDYDKALSTKLYSNASETSTSAKRGLADVTKLGNFIKGGEDLQALTLMTGVAKNTFSFYDEARGKFLVSTTTGSIYLINQVYCDVNTSFAITINSATTAATITNTEGAYAGNLLRYNSNGYFVSNQNTGTTYKDVCIYRLEGAVGEIPVVAAVVTVPDSDEVVTIAEEGAAEATAINDVVFNYVGPWAISVSDNAEWLNVAYDAEKNCLTYTADANTGAKRETTVTITATLEGHQSLTWSFNLVQKGAPQEISIAEFVKKGQDVDTVYKLTGIITEIPSSTSGKWKLADENGNTAQVQYFKTEAGAYVKGNVDVKVGDVISLTTVVAGTTVGLGGNSTYPSLYKGHYSLAATSSGSVGYEGGDVTVNIEVVKSGHIDAPTAISDSEVAIDANIITNYSFTDNGNGTATAVLSFGLNETSGMREVELTFAAGSPLVTKATITVSQDVNPALKKGWWLVTDVNDLKAGDKLIIAATGLDYAISTETYTNSRKSKPITKNGASLKDVADNIQQYALEVDANGLYSFKGTLGTDADKYIYASSSSSNYMKVTSTLDDNGKFTVAIASDGEATVIAQGSNTRNHMQYNNKSTSSPAFYCTDGSFGNVCFYKLYE